MDEGEQARTASAQRATSTSESDYSEVSETFEDSASLHQLSAPTRGDVYTSIGPTRQVNVPPIAQDLIQNAKNFLMDKLKRATAEDLIVDEDAVSLPKIKPRVAYLLLAINVGVYAAGLVAGLGPEGADAQQDYFLALAKTDVGVEAGEYYRLITANFLHDSFVHLGSSCYALATVAPAIEEVLGWDIFLATYLLSSVGGSVGTFILGDAVTVGASSGIFGVIGALVAYLWKNRCLERTSQQLTSIAGVVGVNLVMGGIQETSIDNIGHAAGLLVGAYIGYGLSPVLLPPKDRSAGATASASTKSDEQKSEGEQVDVMHVDHSGALRRWAGYISFATTLALVTAGTVVMRTGELPAPKALELLVF
ncbi:probable RHOMBOID-like protein 10, chloroplastic [Coccomyxa sp. Obi]|nr:probable RHOMBOID-like protein 10, chloroplastic [Coccomyxa sp. Obi]